MMTTTLKLRKEYKSIADITYNIPDIQRGAGTAESQQHIDNLYASYNDYYTTHGEYVIPASISICTTRDTSEYLLDGQHRLSALRRLSMDYPERKLEILVDYYECDNYEDLYKQINNVIPNNITKMEKNVYKIINELEKKFEANFKDYIVKTDKPRVPHINVKKLLEYINDENVIDRANIVSSEDFWDRIIALNRFYAGMSEAQFTAWKITNISSALNIIRGKKSQLYLGLYKNFEWVGMIIAANTHGITYDKMHHYDSTYRPKITKKLRNEVWGTKLIAGACYVCASEITNTEFECAHIVPVCVGGATTKENLRPTCRGCNRDMGVMNLEDYKLIYQQQAQL